VTLEEKKIREGDRGLWRKDSLPPHLAYIAYQKFFPIADS